MTFQEIADHLGRTRMSVRNFIRRNLPRRDEKAQKEFREIGAKLTSERNKTYIGSKNPNWKGGITKNYYHYKKIQLKRYPERVKCRQLVTNALSSGKLKRPSTCSSCGGKCKPHAHHDDYSKPLDVDWLCRHCHRKLHGGKH